MENVVEVPETLIYEEFEGHPIYRKGYRDFLLGGKTIGEIMYTSTLQWFIITALLRRILEIYRPDQYMVGTNEPGIHIEKGTNLSNDIVIYRKGQVKVGFNSVQYADVPPLVAIEIDIKADASEFFGTEVEYFQKKTEKLLRFGVQNVVWITSSTQRVMIASDLNRWETLSWDISFELFDGHSINIWQLMLDNGFEA